MPRRFPSLSELFERPATAGLAAMAIVVTVASRAGYDVSALAMDGDVLFSRPWTLFTSALPHVDALHLVFNVYWLCLLGVHVERELGSVTTFLAYGLWGIAAAAAEHALFEGGVGLSGIGFGVLAYGWARGLRDPGWALVVDRRTTVLFGLWFVFCIITTVTGWIPVANVAHAVGAVMGALTALLRWPGRAAIGGTLLGLALAGSLALDLPEVRARVNLTGAASRDAEQRGLAALEAGDVAGAIADLERATLRSSEGRTFHNLGVAYDRAERDADACASFERAEALTPGTETAEVLTHCARERSTTACTAGDCDACAEAAAILGVPVESLSVRCTAAAAPVSSAP